METYENEDGELCYIDDEGNEVEIDSEDAKEIAARELDAQRKSQERYQSAMDGLMTAFAKGITAEALEAASRFAAEKLADSIQSAVRKELRELISAACGVEVKKLAQQHMKVAVAQVLAKQIVQDPNRSWDQTKVSIAEIVRKEMQEAIQSLKDDRGGRRDATIKEAINLFMSKEVALAAQAAVTEFKKEAFDQLSKETMKTVVVEVSKALGADPKFMKLISMQS